MVSVQDLCDIDVGEFRVSYNSPRAVKVVDGLGSGSSHCVDEWSCGIWLGKSGKERIEVWWFDEGEFID